MAMLSMFSMGYTDGFFAIVVPSLGRSRITLRLRYPGFGRVKMPERRGRGTDRFILRRIWGQETREAAPPVFEGRPAYLVFIVKRPLFAQ